ncbi:hypothetical protein M438DRAFT_404750 [Aureobasidium pullulans EXF-150]|uniref:Amidohydrolase-related domain-containing protein n=1 Tax=Aureobasidium pullulans EXF-150 TaxID=1043002 RepID=A0A074YEI7_AURPU|nr:uncharacterized protein M438DRAFT_404750 [Aureobasidium pullulans EXF-150]KEQ85261.1 hypothetical protein M438DRAFT_404750 [Aureobasidium pullulans EXF-150]
MVPPMITLEEHYLSQNVRKHLADTGREDPYAQFPKPLIDKLTSLGSDRLEALDNGNVSLQVLSHSPLNASPDECRATNDNLASAIKDQPRYAAFALLPMASPSSAASELERCVKQHKFVGALINNHCNGTFYDGESFRPVFAKAEELDVPIYIHPTFAADEWMPHYRGNFGEKAAIMMSIAAWGWHSETGLHVLRLWASGLFDEYPKLKIIIGHMGEMLPYQLDRIISTSASWAPDNKRGLEQVWKENFWITTSGMFSLAPLSCLLRMCERDRILYSVDYPFSGNEKGLKFIEEVESSGMSLSPLNHVLQTPTCNSLLNLMSTFFPTMLPSILKPTRQDEIQITPSPNMNNIENSIIENCRYLHPEKVNFMLVTSSYSGLHGAHIVERPQDGGKRLMSSSFRTTTEKALKELLEQVEGEVYRRLYGYGGLKVRELGK